MRWFRKRSVRGVIAEYDAAQMAAAHGDEAERFCRTAMKSELRPGRRHQLELVRRALRAPSAWRGTSADW